MKGVRIQPDAFCIQRGGIGWIDVADCILTPPRLPSFGRDRSSLFSSERIHGTSLPNVRKSLLCSTVHRSPSCTVSGIDATVTGLRSTNQEPDVQPTQNSSRFHFCDRHARSPLAIR